MTETIEDSVETFLDLESDLQELAKPGVATPDVTGAESGSVVGAERVSTDSVPVDYPVPIDGDSALALEVRVDVDTTAIVFLNWPDDGTSFDQIEQLLSETGVAFDSFADLYGEAVPLAVLDGFLVASLQYGLDAPTTDAGDRPSARESESGSTGTDETDDSGAIDGSASNQWVGITLLSIGMTWVYYEMAFRTGPSMGMGIWWVLIAFFLLGGVESDRAWVNATTDRELPKWWSGVVPLAAPIAAPLYLLEHRRALNAARLDRTDLGSVHRTNRHLGQVVSHYDGKHARIVVLERGLRIQSLDADPLADEGASFTYGEIDTVSPGGETATGEATTIDLNGIPGSRDLISVEFPGEADVNPVEVVSTIHRQERIWNAVQRTDAEPETLAASDTAVVVLTTEGVSVFREDDEDAFVPLERVGDVGIDYDTTRHQPARAAAAYHTPYAYFEDTGVKTVGEPVEKVYCPDDKAEFRAFVESVADRSDDA